VLEIDIVVGFAALREGVDAVLNLKVMLENVHAQRRRLSKTAID